MANISNKCIFSLLMLLFILFAAHSPMVVQARPLPSSQQQRYLKVLSTLGIMCRCCDGSEGECTSTWEGSCSNLDCSPWRSSSRL
ncbi:hypothetical protein H6P81_005963 [Aristolochia fimbriata]|uniref:Uncharacterized protein n=1 Tax=Aristolochia fimbriata TaxID=158543 RepID=A0AAV7EX11_ARIFI|nr:hypothetical protein H6P81_005963 [Aristolochia fimbriata]